VHLLIPAAGSGSRMKAGKNKLLLELNGHSILYWTIKSVFLSETVKWVGLIGQPDDREKILNSIKEFSKRVNWINGGNTRQESVRNGLLNLPTNANKVLIHDGARCFVRPHLIDKCSIELKKNDAIVLAVRVTDTVKIVNQDGFVLETPDRNSLWAAQTPQGFLVSKLKDAHEIALKNNWEVTDDASLFELLNWKVKVIEGNPNNIKITNPNDLKIANYILSDY
tara:strand:- start:4636 stop:5307 length:672 start_codon:yes stop_codon:yes gene_type:complete